MCSYPGLCGTTDTRRHRIVLQTLLELCQYGLVILNRPCRKLQVSHFRALPAMHRSRLVAPENRVFCGWDSVGHHTYGHDEHHTKGPAGRSRAFWRCWCSRAWMGHCWHLAPVSTHPKRSACYRA